MTPDCEVLIVGGGLVGLSLACALATPSCRVRVLEAGPEYVLPSTPGLRVSAINPSSQRLLTELGAWEKVPEANRCGFTHMRVWDEGVAPFGDRALEFAGADLGVAPLGHIVHNDALQWALFECARQSGHVDIVFGTKVDDLVTESDGIRAFSENQTQHTARLLIGADGMHSRVRELSSIEVVRKSYSQKGIVCNVRPERSHENTAWQRFLSTGPVALLPLGNGEVSIVWSLVDEEAARLKELDDAAFARELADACDHVLGAMEVTSARVAFPLGLLRAKSYTASRVALLGDAAHVVHPLAGQGVNLGFGDVVTLTAMLEEGASRGDQLGDQFALRRFERARKYENRKMQLTVDGLHHLFGSRQPWLQSGRSLGMGLLNQWPSIKGRLAGEALGTV